MGEIKTAIYVRVSTEEQAKEGFSIGAQQEKLRDYIRVKGWELYNIYIDDGISGKNITDRPALTRLIEDVEQGNVKNVLVFKIDRLTRSTKDLIYLMDLFNEKGCGFNSLTESIDTHTPSGRMFIKIIGIFAEFERENIIERVSVALEKKVKDGYSLTNFIVPYGYDRKIGSRDITINEEESKIIKEIFHMYLNHHKSFHAIADDLSMRGIKAQRGNWGNQAIRYILSNPIYIGKVRYGATDKTRYFEADGKHEAIIPAKIFYETRDKMEKMQKTIKKRPREENYFCGTLMCAICGCKMTTHGHYTISKDKKEIYYGNYLCLGRKRVGCSATTFSHNKIEKAFCEFIGEYEDFTVEPDFNVEVNELVQDKEKVKSEYEAMLSKLIQKEKDIMRLYIADKVDFEEYNNMLEIIRHEKKGYTAKLTELENANEQPNNVGLQKEDIITSLKENWDFLTNMERMQFLQTYVQAIYAQREPDTQEIKVKRLEFYKN